MIKLSVRRHFIKQFFPKELSLNITAVQEKESASGLLLENSPQCSGHIREPLLRSISSFKKRLEV